MSGSNPPSLAEYLRSEALITSIEYERETATVVAAPPPVASVRVPLEVGGTVWCAQVERVAEAGIRLLVAREALSGLIDRAQSDAGLDASIRYQPDNCSMQRISGTLRPTESASGDRVEVEFQVL